MRNLEKLKFNGLHMSKKYIPSAKTLYKEDLSNITFNYCENSPNSSCHFWNHKLFFTTQLVCIFLAQTLHTFDRNIASKRTFSDFPLLEFKVQIIRLSTIHMRISQIPCIIFQATSQFSFKFCITFKCYDTKFFWNFPSELLRFGQIERIKVQILKFSSLFNVMKDSSSVFFFISNLYILNKKQFSDFWIVVWKFTKFLMSHLKLQVSFSLNFASLLQCHER